MTTPYLDALKRAAEAQQEAETLRLKEFNDVLAEVKEKIKLYQFSAKDLGFADVQRAQELGKGRSDGRAMVAPKYRSPTGETWAGRGKVPAWLQEYEKKGGDREQLRV
jgi:DNA-binding protein H-NS